MASNSSSAAGDVPFVVEVKTESTAASFLGARILALCRELPQGVGDKLLQASMPDVDSRERASAINALLSEGKIDLFRSAEKGLLYRARQLPNVADPSAAASGGGQALGGGIRGDAEEKLVYKIIEEAGNKGTWIRDIRIKSNLVQTQLNKVLKSLKSKKVTWEFGSHLYA
jgi:DNA-directed RNA polymerase III subunit RPC6